MEFLHHQAVFVAYSIVHTILLKMKTNRTVLPQKTSVAISKPSQNISARLRYYRM